jgi:hypothetical protein
MLKIRELSREEYLAEKAKFVNSVQYFAGKKCIYLLDFGNNYYKFGLTTDIICRMKTHFRNHYFLSIIGIWDCGHHMLNVE